MQDWGEIINLYGWVGLCTCILWAKKMVASARMDWLVLLQSQGQAARCFGCGLHLAVALPMLRRMHGQLTSATPFLWDANMAVPAARRARPCWHDLRMVFTARPWPWTTTTLTGRICTG